MKVGGLSLALPSLLCSFPSLSSLPHFSLCLPLYFISPSPYFSLCLPLSPLPYFSLCPSTPPTQPHAHIHCLTHPGTHCVCLYSNWIKSVLFPWLIFPSCLTHSPRLSFVLVVVKWEKGRNGLCSAWRRWCGFWFVELEQMLVGCLTHFHSNDVLGKMILSEF